MVGYRPQSCPTPRGVGYGCFSLSRDRLSSKGSCQSFWIFLSWSVLVRLSVLSVPEASKGCREREGAGGRDSESGGAQGTAGSWGEGEVGAGGFGSLPLSHGPSNPLAKVPEAASCARSRGFHLPIDVSLPFIPFDFRAGFF